MKILVINQYFYPDIAATSQIITDLSVELTKIFDLTVLCGKPSYNPADSPKIKFFKLYNFKNCKVIRVWNTSYSRKSLKGRITNYFTFMFSGMLASLLLRGYHLTFSMTDPPFAGFISYINYKLKKIPYIITLQDIHPDIELHTALLKKYIITKTWIKLNKLIFNNSKKIIVLGNSMKNYLIKEYEVPSDKIVIIPNYINDEEVVPQAKMNKFLQDKEFKNCFIVMHSGNIGLNQDLHIVIEAAKLLSIYSDIAFIFIGDGASKEELVKRTKNYNLKNVYFLQYQPKEELSYSLSSADIHLITLASGLTNYIFPSKLYAIMAVGKPSIACIDNESDVAQIIKEAKCGIHIEPHNANKLAETILYLYNNRDLLSEMGKNARSYLEKYLRRKYVIDKYVNLIKSLQEKL